MKVKLLIIAAIVALFTSCKNEEDFQDVIYFTGTEITPTAKYSIDGPADIGISISASCKVNHDVTAQVQARPDLVDAYNIANAKNYKALPEGSYQLSSTSLMLTEGKYVSKPLRLSITSTEKFEEGVTYCLPISIMSVEGELPVLESSRTIYAVINRTIITYAADLNGSTYFTVPFSKDADLQAVPQVTMEARVYMKGFKGTNPFISSLIGIEENFLLRFGDVNIDKNQIQLAGGKFPVTGTLQFETNKWYHVAITYDGAQLKLYVNGELNASTDAPRGTINLADEYSGGFHIGFSAGGRQLNGAVSEVRVWTKALSEMDIANNICYVDPTAEGLLAYWRFNEGTGNDIKDWSGNGWDLTSSRSVLWMEGVRCPE